MLLDRGEHTAKADLHHAEVVDLVYLDLCVQLSSLFQNGTDFVRRDRVYAAAEGNELNEIHVVVLARILRGTVQAGVIRPLVEHVYEHFLALEKHAVFRKDGDIEGGEQFADAVVDLGIDMIRPARQNDDGNVFLLRLGKYFVALIAYVAVIRFQPRKSLFQSLSDEPFGQFVFFERVMQRAHRRLFVVQVYVRHDKIVAVQPLVVRLQKLGIVRDDGAVVMVGRIVLVQIITFAGEEDEIHARVEQAFDMPVRKFRGIADGIARNGVLPPEVQLTGRFFAEDDFKAARFEKSRPKGKLFVKAERQRKPHSAAPALYARRAFLDAIVFVGVNIQLIRMRFQPRALFAFVAGNEFPSVRKADHVDVAVRSAPLADVALGRIRKVFQLFFGDDAAFPADILLCVQCRAERAHQPRDARAHDLFARFYFKRAQNGVVQKGAALHEDVVAEFVRRFGADNFINGVFDDGRGKPRGDIFHARAFLLRLLDGAVHEHRAAAAELHGMFGKKPQLGKLFNFHAHRFGERLNERAAARRTRFVEHDGIDDAVFNFETFDVLPADVDDKIDFGIEIERRLEVRDRFDDAEVGFQRRLHHIFAVACDRRPRYADAPFREGINFAQTFQNDVERLPVVGLVMRIEYLRVGSDEDELGRRRTAVYAEISVPFISFDVFEREVALFMARDERVVFGAVFKERFARHHVVAALCVPDARDRLVDGHGIDVFRIQRRADRHERGRVFGKHRVPVVEVQRVFERLAKPLDKVERPAQKEHFALDAPALRKPRNRLIDDRLKDARGNILFARALIEKGLDVRLCEHAAAGGDRIHLFRPQGKLVHLADGYIEERSHLVDERARAARAAAVHALFGAARDKDDLCVLAAELDSRVRVGVILSYRGKRRLHFLHKGNAAALGKPQARRARYADAKIAAELFFYHGKLRQNAFLDACEVAFVTRI